MSTWFWNYLWVLSNVRSSRIGNSRVLTRWFSNHQLNIIWSLFPPISYSLLAGSIQYCVHVTLSHCTWGWTIFIEPAACTASHCLEVSRLHSYLLNCFDWIEWQLHEHWIWLIELINSAITVDRKMKGKRIFLYFLGFPLFPVCMLFQAHISVPKRIWTTLWL